jgi:hypothetical protein
MSMLTALRLELYGSAHSSRLGITNVRRVVPDRERNA